MLSSSELKWLTYAVNECELAEHSQWRVGAVLVKSGRVLSTGVNRYRNSPSVVKVGGVSYHAEEVAVRKAGSPSGATIYVARTTRSGKIGLARPCLRCQQMLLDNGVEVVVWTTPSGWRKARLRELINEEYISDRVVQHDEKHPLLSR